MAQDLENVIENIINKSDHTDFIWDLLLAYGISKTTITKAKKEATDLFAGQNQIILKKKVLFERVNCCENVLNRLDELQKDERSYAKDPRFIIVTDFKDFAAYDTKTKEAPLAIPFNELYKHSEYFLPWSGREKYEAHLENPADVKAAGKMAKIYDEIYNDNKDFAIENNHALNVFLVRLLFCFFAEDTGIFEGENVFTEAIANHTSDDNLSDFFEQLFESLDKRNKAEYPSYIQQFPYVNGHLFADKHPIPKLNAKVRRLILECGDQNNWAEINPDIFGSMFQAVKDAKVRSGLGQHYTSVPNIMKVINPLFMDGLEEEFQKSYNDQKRLKKLQLRLSKIHIFDPACGSGNFLIIALKQLKLFEMKIIKRLAELNKSLNMQMNLSIIQLKQFYGIEIDDFACEIARLSLWLAEHQMNCKFKEEFGVARPTLPLTQSGHIVCGNACRLDWEKVCPKYIQRNVTDEFIRSDLQNTPMKLELPKEEAEVYILGNPPYLGSALLSAEQKIDASFVMGDIKGYKKIDYIGNWFVLAAKYIQNTSCTFAFVSTNSICQGEIVDPLWTYLLNSNMNIAFAYTDFKWSNNAKDQAGVVCIIIGIKDKKFINQNVKLYTVKDIIETEHINPYLIPTKTDIIISKHSHNISNLPDIARGCMPYDGGNLILTPDDTMRLIANNPQTKQLIKKLYGADDYINDKIRYCLWISDEQLELAKSIPEIFSRIEKTRNMRLKSRDAGANKLAKKAHQFREFIPCNNNTIVIPSTTSSRRPYVPIGFADSDTVLTNLAYAVYNGSLVLFGIISSHMHILWLNTVGGKLGAGYRYTSLVYNSFPFPKITDSQKNKIELYSNRILEVRAQYLNKSLAELYDPDKMPSDLAEAHHNLDLCIESCYKKKPFENDEQRLKHLFKMYELMTSGAKDEDLEQLELL